MKIMSKKTVFLSCIFVIFIVLVFIGILNVAAWMKGSDSPVSSQAILILSGNYTRPFYAADLYKQGYAKEVYITRPVREQSLEMLDDNGITFPRHEDIFKKVLLEKGVPAEHIHLLPDTCVSTFDEAEAASKVFSGKDCRVLIVTSPSHVKRSSMIFRDRMKQCRFKVLATPYEPFPKKWWTDQSSARDVILEVIKIVYYRIGGSFRHKETAGK